MASEVLYIWSIVIKIIIPKSIIHRIVYCSEIHSDMYTPGWHKLRDLPGGITWPVDAPSIQVHMHPKIVRVRVGSSRVH